MKFKSDIELQSGLRDGSNDIGTAGQILSSTGSQTNWIDQDSIVASEAKLVVIECKNTSGVTISKGTPVYQTGTVGATDVIEVDVADASDEDKMAAIGLLQTDIANNAFGKVVITGELLNITTSPIDGVTPVTGDTIYVKSGGGLTLTKPTGVNFIQNIGLVGKVSGGNSGSITVSSIMRSNDVPTPLYIDHTNQRLGIGTTSPSEKLVVQDGNLIVSGSSSELAIGPVAGKSRIFTNSSKDIRFSTAITNDAVFIKNNNGNVGIGTTSPQYNLDIQSESPAIRIKDISDNNSFLVGADNGGAYLGTFTFDALRFFTDSSEKMRIKQNGNVGIGTNNPSAPLSLGNGGAESLELNHNISSSSRILSYNRSNNTYRQLQLDAFEHVFKTSSSEKMRITSAGNVGIGTTSPGVKLDVSGQIRSNDSFLLQSGTTAIGSIRNQGGALDIRGDSTRDVSLGSVTSPQALFVEGTNGNVGIGTTSPSKLLTIAAESPTLRFEDISSSNYTEMYVNNFDTYLNTNGRFFIQNQGSTKFTVKSDGNVGIGTTSPSNKLTIGQAVDDNGLKILGYDDESGSSVSLSVSSAGHARLSQTTDGSSGYLFLQAENYLQLIAGTFIYTTSTFRVYDNTQLQFGNSGDYKIYYSTSADNLYIHTNDNKGINVSNTGGVQFNTYGAGTLVTDASGNITVSSGGGAGGPYLPLAGGTMTGTNGVLMPDNFKLNLGTGSDLQIYHDGSNSYIKDTGTGNLRIRSTSLRLEGTDSSNMLVGSEGDSVSLYFNNSKKFETSNTGVSVTGNGIFTGNVGIGTTSPSEKLDVYGNAIVRGDIVARDTYPSIYVNHSGTAMGGIRSDATNKLELKTLTTAPLSFQVNSSEKMRINSSGNVGIGTTSPNHKLDVNGGAQFNTNTGATPFYITRLGGTSQALSIKVMDDNVRFESIQDETADDYGGFDFRMDGGTTEPDFVVRKNAGNPILNVKGNGNVGIGTTSPTSKLFITAADGEMVDTYMVNILNQELTAGDNFGVQIRAGLNTSDVSLNVANKDGSSLFRVRGDGNVGIGTTGPSSKLQVEAAAGQATTLNNSVANSALRINADTANGSNNIRIGESGSGSYFLQVSNSAGTTPYAINLNPFGGNVGIGTTSPTFKLHVNSTDASDNVAYIHHNNAAQSSGDVLKVRSDAGDNAGSALLNVANNTGSALYVRGDRNVGIGTTNPGAKLDIINSGLGTMFRLSNTEANATTKYGAILGRHYTNAEENVTGMLITSSSSATGGTVSIGGGISASNAVNNVLFYTAANNTTLVGTERMRINSSGNVGIGTTNPTNKLHIQGSQATVYNSTDSGGQASAGTTINNTNTAGNTNNFSQLLFTIGTNNNSVSRIVAIRSGSDASDLAFVGESAAGVAEYMRIKSGGNVGIGTTSPSQS